MKIHKAWTESSYSYSANHVGSGFTITGDVLSTTDKMFGHKASEQYLLANVTISNKYKIKKRSVKQRLLWAHRFNEC